MRRRIDYFPYLYVRRHVPFYDWWLSWQRLHSLNDGLQTTLYCHIDTWFVTCSLWLCHYELLYIYGINDVWILNLESYFQMETHQARHNWISAESTVYSKKYAHGFCFAVLCCGYTLTDFPISIVPVPEKQPWWIWINTSCEFIMNDCITTTKQSTTKPSAYFLGYTVWHAINNLNDICTRHRSQ